MVVLTAESKHQLTMSKTIGYTARSVLLRAIVEKRVIVGIPSAIEILLKTPKDSLFCFLAQSKNPDSAIHMNEILLEAFCYENDIYVVKVDSDEKLSRILGAKSLQTCALIQKSYLPDNTEELTPAEDTLVNHCEEYWDFPNKIMELPV
ncbi:growth arrest and DNA damage-inducible protein GADD45 alpha-like [Bradysia coprophila]|uniref:growth arrest and DNA damage-inducible protein GADD45 alpha-like n=1 Tax=Bradysia coprophila TaxID=38358 RepID=UPI00187D7EF2|nr:growth arrest and DNA damage-inducible protein GADD45 alpha-like [Bradysia coprophila]